MRRKLHHRLWTTEIISRSVDEVESVTNERTYSVNYPGAALAGFLWYDWAWSLSESDIDSSTEENTGSICG